MIIALLAFFGGALTILSPCILPVLPFVFARSGQSFARSTLPLLLGMALTFAAIATLAAVGGAWAVRINSYGRVLALAMLAAFGAALLSRRIADALAKPFVAFGNRLLRNNDHSGVLQSFVIGVATGFLWAPCAGPILGLILTGAAISGPNAQISLLLFAYALGAMVSLALATLAGKKIFDALKRSFNAGEWLRRGLGIAVIAAVVAIASGADTGVLTRLSLAGTNRLEQSLLSLLHPDNAMQAAGSVAADSNAVNSAAADSDTAAGGAMMAAVDSPADAATTGTAAMTGANAMTETDAATENNAPADNAMMSSKPVARAPRGEGRMPALDGAVAWLNSPPLSAAGLRGKVVLIDFWTYSCINCLRSLPYVKAWYERYKDRGLVVIGVHAPEFAFEKDEKNVRRAVRDLGVTYPVALDNKFAIWQAFNNHYWPAHYFIDANGRIRGHHFGEGDYEESEQLIRKLLAEANGAALPAPSSGQMRAEGAQAASDDSKVASPETYLGYDRAENFAAPDGLARDRVKTYSAPDHLRLNHWALNGDWLVGAQQAQLKSVGGKIIYRFRARDVHLVLGPGADGKPVRFRVSIDGAEPIDANGVDTDAKGEGVIREQRLYQLIRQRGEIGDRTFTIEFLDAGARAYAFTFG